jgi:large subunit ribosomal protein L6
MSRIGNSPIEVPKGVTIKIDGRNVDVKGTKGSLSQAFHPDMKIELDNGILSVKRPTESNQHKALHGLTRSLLNNMVVGVSDGFTRVLEIEGVGYRAELKGQTLVLNVGYSHPIMMEPTRDLSFDVQDRGKTIIVTGTDKQVVGETSAKIRKTRPPEPYKGKGIHYRGEHIRRKAGKAGKV